MNRVKKIWEENKVLLVLAIILIICLVVFSIVSMTYFYGSSKSSYGNRLDKIKDVAITDDFIKESKEKIREYESVKDINITVKGSVIYVNLYFNDNTKMDNAKKIAESSLELFSEEVLKVYDINYIIYSKFDDEKNTYTLMGARNSNSDGLVIWNNYNIEKESAE